MKASRCPRSELSPEGYLRLTPEDYAGYFLKKERTGGK